MSNWCGEYVEALDGSLEAAAEDRLIEREAKLWIEPADPIPPHAGRGPRRRARITTRGDRLFDALLGWDDAA